MDEIEALLKEKKQMIDDSIKKYLPEKFDSKYLEWAFGKPRYSYNVEALNKTLAEPIWDLLKRGGKRWRPALFLLIAEALEADIEKIKDFVVPLELIHNGSLAADDIEDRSELRRGEPCMHIKFGVDVAVNASTFMYFLPFLTFLRNNSSFDSKTMIKALDAALQELINIHVGQGLDIAWHNGKGGSDKISEGDYLQMCMYKTGTLARLSARLAVILSGGSEQQEEALGKFAESVGVAFQIQDDILSASGEKFQERKGYGDDITEGKRTLLIIHTLSKASETDKGELIHILNSHTTDRVKISAALAIISKYGAIEYARDVAKKMVKDAWDESEKTLKESEAKQKMKKFADFLIDRQI